MKKNQPKNMLAYIVCGVLLFHFTTTKAATKPLLKNTGCYTSTKSNHLSETLVPAYANAILNDTNTIRLNTPVQTHKQAIHGLKEVNHPLNDILQGPLGIFGL
jgi:hypothetical protein